MNSLQKKFYDHIINNLGQKKKENYKNVIASTCASFRLTKKDVETELEELRKKNKIKINGTKRKIIQL